MNATALQNRHESLIARLHQFATNPDIDIKVFLTWLAEQQFSDSEIASARLDYLLIRLAQLSKSGGQVEISNFQTAIARLEYSDDERKIALQEFNRQSPQPTPSPQSRPQSQRPKVAAPNPLDIGKLPAPDDRLKDETHQLGVKIAEVATQFKIPLVYEPERSRKSIRVKRLFFKPDIVTDLSKVGGLRSNFVGHAGMQPQASILVVPGGVEIHDPIPGDEWERPHFKRYVQKTTESKPIENGFSYTVGVDLDGKALVKSNIIGLLISGVTGSGKSYHGRSMLNELSLRYSPRHLQLALFDVCGLTYKDFGDSPWLFQPPCLAPKDYESRMKALWDEVQNREKLFTDSGSIEQWNREYPDKPVPHILMLIEEHAETVARVGWELANKIPASISRIGRKLGFCFVVTTQVPKKEDFDEDLLRNLFDRVCFQAADIGASYTGFGYNEGCATQLQMQGDGYLKSGSAPIRFQSLYLGDDGGKFFTQQIHSWGSSTYGTPEPDVWDFDEPEADPDREIYDRILLNEPEFKANRISETEYLCRVFQFADRAKMTGNTKNKYRTQAAQIKGKFRNA